MITTIVWFLFLCYLIARLTVGICRSSRCLVGKTALITGGNAGIGYEVALNLASRGCRVIIAARNNLEETKNQIVTVTGNPAIICKKLDLSSFKLIREFAKDIKETEDRIDILIHNSAVPVSGSKATEDGHDLIMQVNHLGPFLLTHLLLGKLGRGSRIIFTSSIMAFLSNLDLDNVRNSTKVSGLLRNGSLYCDTKLTSIMIASIFAKKLESSGITVNSLHPGWVRTSIYQKLGQTDLFHLSLTSLVRFTGLVLSKDPWEGAQTTIELAVSEKVENVTGKYFVDCRQYWKPSLARNEELCEKLWTLSEDLVKLSAEEKI